MYFLYVVDHAIYRVHEEPDPLRELPLNEELCFKFETKLHPLNILLSGYFAGKSGYFHYDASVIYVVHPSFYVISTDTFPALHNLVLRVEAFESFAKFSIASAPDGSTTEER